MTRLENRCCGDCGNCELLRRGDVDMVPCVLDQIFQRVQSLEKRISAIDAEKSDKKVVLASAIPSVNCNNNMQ